MEVHQPRVASAPVLTTRDPALIANLHAMPMRRVWTVIRQVRLGWIGVVALGHPPAKGPTILPGPPAIMPAVSMRPRAVLEVIPRWRAAAAAERFAPCSVGWQ